MADARVPHPSLGTTEGDWPLSFYDEEGQDFLLREALIVHPTKNFYFAPKNVKLLL